MDTEEERETLTIYKEGLRCKRTVTYKIRRYKGRVEHKKGSYNDPRYELKDVKRGKAR